MEQGIERVLKNRSTKSYFPSPADILTEVIETDPDTLLLASPVEDVKSLTPEEENRYQINMAFTLWCMRNDHTPDGGVIGWQKERDQFGADIADGKIKLSRHVKTGNLFVDALSGAFKQMEKATR